MKRTGVKSEIGMLMQMIKVGMTESVIREKAVKYYSDQMITKEEFDAIINLMLVCMR